MFRVLACVTLFALPAMLSAVEYPETERVDHTDEYKTSEGQKVTVEDPYRWLEEDVRESDRVAEWVKQQQTVTDAYLSKLPSRAAFEKRLTKLWNYERRSAPSRLGKPGESPQRYTYRQNDGLQNQSVVYLTDSPQAEGKVLLDPNTWSDDGTIALDGYSSSRDGKLLGYLKSEAGSDWKTIHVMNLETGEKLNDVLKWTKFGGVQWDIMGNGFLYKRYPEPKEGEAFQASALNPSVCYHKLGTPQSEDKVIYHDPDHPDWGCSVYLTEDGLYYLLLISSGTDHQNKLFYRPQFSVDSNFDPRAGWIPLAEDFENEFSPIAVENNRLFLETDYNAPRKRVVAVDLLKEIDKPFRERLVEIVPEAEETLGNASLTGGKLFCQYLKDVAAAVLIYSPDGKPLGEVALPGVGSVGGFGGWKESSETFYTYTSYNAPPTTYRYDIATGESEKIFEPNVGTDLSQYTVRREFYPSKDGTKIPVFLMHRKEIELNGKNPTLLYGYGGFAISVTPGYSPSRLAWVEQGGVLAVANLRGGGEYGEAWHQAGKTTSKQNVFDDFIAAGEWLIEQKITTSKHLAIQGGSNGGLLVGAVMTQRPELFGACLPAVGVMDMLRFHRFTAGQFWRDEYGSADDPALFSTLRGYSPYHNVKRGVNYPPTMVITADTDDRVVPMHSFKFAAALQNAQQNSEAGDSPLLIRIETRAGHGAGKPTSKRIEEAADLWAFLWEHVGSKE